VKLTQGQLFMKSSFSISLCALIYCASMLLSPSLSASEESHNAAAKEMVEVAKVDKMLEAMYQQINTMLIKNLLSQDPCLESIRQPLIDLFVRYDEKILNPEVVKAEVQKVYVQEFTEDEIKQIVAFYKTPAGQKALDKSPLLAAKGMEIAQKEVEKSKNAGVMDSLQKDINALIDGIDPNTLSAECKKKFEERKARLKDEKSKVPAAPTSTTTDKTKVVPPKALNDKAKMGTSAPKQLEDKD
jgi:hypothetical protein